MAGVVEQIHVADAETAPCRPVDEIGALTGRGLEGDRCLAPPDQWARSGCGLTMIEAEGLEAGREQHASDFANGRFGPKITTRGIALTGLVGREFVVGGVRCR